MARRPPLYRSAQMLRLLATVVTILVILFAGLVVYSASEIRPHWAPGGFSQSGNDTILVRGNLTIQNPGYFAIDRLSIASIVRLSPANQSILAFGGAPPRAVAAGGTTVVPVEFTFPLGSSVDYELLTQDLELPSETWVNATYATAFSIVLTVPENLSWGAPFAQFNATPGTPTAEANGTLAVPFSASFHDDASFPVDGTLRYHVDDPQGAQCSAGSFPLAVAAHSGFQGGSTVYLTSACEASGSSLAWSFDGPTWSVTLPGERFP